MSTKIVKLFLVVFFLQIAAFVVASERIETRDFSVVYQKAHELAQKYGSQGVLIVYDIDNTLLAMNQDLGSDQWFTWQETKIKNGDFTDVVAKDFPGLLSVQGILYALSSMHLPQTETPALIAQLQSENFTNLVLTSRGSDYRNATVRELERNSIHMAGAALEPKKGFASTYLPYDLNHISDSGLTAEEVKAWGLGQPRPVSYEDGIFMGSGQHKGAMLRTLLYKTGSHFPAIIFIDDQVKHLDRMEAAFVTRGVELITVRYGKEDDAVLRFQNSDKEDVIEQWNDLDLLLKELFPAERAYERDFLVDITKGVKSLE
ncbi:MAG: DUF2608 domain-containing protein [Deltaproteobacteria bacterium]|nr:DUF2608 domain-containing protein [Deltaproteobacteria bacterium]